MSSKLHIVSTALICVLVSSCVDFRWRKYAKNKEAPTREMQIDVEPFFAGVAVSADKTLLAYADRMKPKLGILSLDANRVDREMAGNWDSTQSLAFASDNEELLVGTGMEGIIYIFDIDSGDPVRLVKTEEEYVRALACSPVGKYCASGGDGGCISLWNWQTGDEIGRFAGHASGIPGGCLKFGKDGTRLLSGSWDGSIRLWNVETGEEEVCLNYGAGRVVGLDLSDDNKRALSCYLDDVVYWDLAQGKEIDRFAVPGNPWFANRMLNAETVEFSPSGDQALFCMAFGSMIYWDVANWEEIEHNRIFKKRASFATFVEHGSKVLGFGIDRYPASSCEDVQGVIRWWELPVFDH